MTRNNSNKMQQENFFGQYFDKYFTCERQKREENRRKSTGKTNKIIY